MSDTLVDDPAIHGVIRDGIRSMGALNACVIWLNVLLFEVSAY